MVLTWPDILVLLLIFQLLFTCIYLFVKKNSGLISNKLLGCFFLSICITLVDYLMLRTGVWYNYPAFANISSAFPLLYGPLLFLYTQSLIYKNFRIDKKKLFHFFPFLFLFLALTISYQMQSAAVQTQVLRTIHQHHLSTGLYLVSLIIIIHFNAYAFRSLSLIKKYKAIALNKFSSVQKINLGWLSSTIIFFVVIFLLSLLNNIFELSSQSGLYPITLLAIILSLFYFINRVLFKALNNPEYFSWMHDDEPYTGQSKRTVEQPDKTGELELLNNHMKLHKPYLNPDLTIEILAKELRVQPKELSKLINERLQQNFFDFINRYRISEAQDILANHPDKKITVLEVLYKTGFNSKSSFNTLFKKYTGLTPTAFKAKNLHQ